VRAPLSGEAFNVTGKPSQMGGAVASVAGWLVLLVGLSIALGLGLLFWAFFSVTVGLAISLPFAITALGIGALLLRGGTSLRRSGALAQRETRDRALLNMAAHHGPVTALDAARLLNVTVGAADAMLTELAKRDPDRLAIDVDDHGVIWYRLARPFFDPGDPGGGPRLRVDQALPGEPEDAAFEPEAAERRRRGGEAP
jgi:hypothetical protein